jgi:hypothetical protein
MPKGRKFCEEEGSTTIRIYSVLQRKTQTFLLCGTQKQVDIYCGWLDLDGP